MRRLIAEARSRARQGTTRVRVSFVPIIQATIAAGLAYLLAGWILGHEQPFFAPIAAWTSLGFVAEKDMRRVFEVALGVTIGVGLGDLVVANIGSGAWQIMFVLALTAVLSRFVSAGILLTTQAGVQAIVIVGLPQALDGGAIGRWTDALVGGAVALLIAAVWPTDHRRRPRILAARCWRELSRLLGDFAGALRDGGGEDIAQLMVVARAEQPSFDEWHDTAKSSFDMVKVSPQARRHSETLSQLLTASTFADRAMRNARVMIRRSESVVDGSRDTAKFADLIDDLATAVGSLGREMGSGARTDSAVAELQAVAGRTDPFEVGGGDWQVQSLVMLCRSLVIDLQEAAGVEAREARAAVPPL